MAGTKGKVCLAYSGGLDTSTILAWLLEQQYEVVCYLANVGQEEDWASVEKKALQIGATKMIIDDLRKVFVDELCWKAVQCNAVYEDQYLLGTSLARPVIARGMMKAAEKEGCDFVSHGCTGKGWVIPLTILNNAANILLSNDQVRFELAYLTINPAIKVIAPWRDPLFYQRFQGRNDLLDYAAEKCIPVTSTRAKPYSMDDNLAHCSYEAGMLEDPNTTPPEDMWTRTVSPLKAPDTPLDITVHFDKGIPVKVVTPQQTVTDSLELFTLLNALGKEHGVGRIDIVENRFIGLKSRDDSPCMSILRLAHISIEGLVLDGRVRSLRDNLSKQWSELLYNGLYFSPERAFLQPSLDFSQQRVNGEVRLRLYKGSAYVLGRTSQEKLYSEEDASMDSLTTFDPSETSGFITINAIRLKKYGLQMAEAGVEL
ncbi:arginosuccinate synthase domain-containing protein [Hirsutella rhossiliensis]|uniref:Argininosuccinate synthase n=1 Tax=Hirsutella rhossiliensis TaxID=111463 RepID=A0A9P8MXY0_9HYPO|nr:arginosuccinate synthase domain-containing protein [Hirsutella rhossiliensis]KAH0962321.1 arginosuccinate synthase domain-containing protein [Hirsutella rhossiliensis]